MMLMVITKHCYHQCRKTQGMQGAMRENMQVNWKLNKKLNRKLIRKLDRKLKQTPAVHATVNPCCTPACKYLVMGNNAYCRPRQQPCGRWGGGG